METITKQGGLNSIESSMVGILEEYRLSLESSNRSPKTIAWYMDILRRFCDFLQSENLVKPIHELGRLELRAYIRHLQNSTRWANRPHNGTDSGKLSPESIQGHVRAVKAFWGWLAREGYIEKNPLSRYPLPKVPQKIMNILHPKQVAAFLTTTDKTTHIGARNHLIIMLLYDGGFRVSELLNIRLEDLRVHEGCIRVLGKGQKQRLVPISGLTKKEIIHFLNRFRPLKCADTDYLFTRADGEPLSVNAVQQLLKRWGKAAGIAGVRCSPHTFRHSFATQFLANGGNVFALKDIMGHSTLQTTLKYSHLQMEDLKNQHDKYSPVAALVKSARAK